MPTRKLIWHYQTCKIPFNRLHRENIQNAKKQSFLHIKIMPTRKLVWHYQAGKKTKSRLHRDTKIRRQPPTLFENVCIVKKIWINLKYKKDKSFLYIKIMPTRKLIWHYQTYKTPFNRLRRWNGLVIWACSLVWKARLPLA